MADITATTATHAVARAEREPYALDWVNIAGISFYHLVALLAFVPWFFSWTGVIVWFIGNYLFCTIGINVFYHRFLTHKGFQCPKWLEYTMAVLAVCSFQDTPARWVAIHRRHHEHADDEPDPHTPVRSFLWAHVGWLLVKQPELSRHGVFARYAKDVLRDPFYCRLENGLYYFGIIYLQWVLFFAVPFGISLLAGGTPATRRSSGSACWSGACSCAPCSICTTPGPSIRSPICGATATTRPTSTAATTSSSATARWARAGTTIIMPIRARPATAIAGGSSTSPI